jgi:hypothetical protein
MKIRRLYTDAAGDTRFDQVEIELGPTDFGVTRAPIDLSAPVDVTRLIFAGVPPGWVGERHTASLRRSERRRGYLHSNTCAAVPMVKAM